MNIIEPLSLPKSLYLRFSVKFTKVSGDVSTIIKSLSTKKMGRVHYLANKLEWDRAYVKVKYGDTEFENEGWYDSLEDFKSALSAFTEPELLEYVGNYA